MTALIAAVGILTALVLFLFGAVLRLNRRLAELTLDVWGPDGVHDEDLDQLTGRPS